MHILRTLRVFYSEREMLECISFGHRSCAGASKRPVSYTECATPFFLVSHRDVFLQYRPRGTPLQPHRSAVSRPRLRRRCSPLGRCPLWRRQPPPYLPPLTLCEKGSFKTRPHKERRRRVSHYRVIEDVWLDTYPISIHGRRVTSERVTY
jgi:hypothetical protein